jgi:hypothetical protein
LLLAVVPVQATASKIEKSKCCSTMKPTAAAEDCAQHAPKSDPEKQCCAACAIGLAIVTASGMGFVYPSTGDESFASFLVRELIRSDRPQIPPPRSSVA